jgi:TolA-binding protein
MTKLQASLCLVFLLATACAHQKPSLQKTGSLDKLSRQAKVQKQTEEVSRLRQILAEERSGVLKSSKAREFPLPQPATDENIYALIIKAYQERNLEQVSFYSGVMRRQHGRSIFTDNAIYLSGQLQLAFGLYSQALKDFEDILKNYPLSNKRPAALLGKGIAYRKLQLYLYSEKALIELKGQYPGSPEFFKAEIEEKLLALERSS